MSFPRIAVVGDFDPSKRAHAAIEASFTLAGTARVWLETTRIIPGQDQVFNGFDGIWCAPGSPYRNPAGALWAIQFARTRQLPFLGTCGGVQHALLEYARNVLGLTGAAHAEDDPQTDFPLLHRMQCSLVEKSQRIIPVPGTSFRQIYGADSGTEEFHCSFGLNPAYEKLFAGGPLEIVARSDDGEVRAVALRSHPFFVGTLFQPERRALAGTLHPVVSAFFHSCASHSPLP